MFLRLDIIVALQVCTHEVHGDLILIVLRLSLNLSEYLSIDSILIYIPHLDCGTVQKMKSSKALEICVAKSHAME